MAEGRFADFYATWMARIDGVSEHLRILFTGVTGMSTLAIPFQSFGLMMPWYPLTVSAAAIAVVLYAHWYSENNVWNEMAKSRVDWSTNYSGPTMLYDALIRARQYSILLAQIEDRSQEEIYQDMVADTLDEWGDYRDGLDIDELEDQLENGDVATVMQDMDR